MRARSACDLRAAATTKCVAERISEQLSHKTAEKCVQKCIWLLQRNAFRDSRAPRVDRHVV
eukprot:5304321-Lingulodinium_polyedra.AAC.1